MLQVMITSSVLILILIGLRYLLRGKISQRLQYALWLLAALRLLLPFQIGSLSISISNLTDDTSASVSQMMAQPVRQIQATRMEEPRQPQQTPEVNENAVDLEAVPPVVTPPETAGATAGNSPENQQVTQTPAKTPTQTVTPAPAVTAEAAREPLTVGQVLEIVWLSGVGLMALWFLGVNLVYSRRVRRSAEAWAVEGSPIPVMVSDTIQTPCLLGFFRPRVYLTTACAASPEATRHVLAHELTHYRHGDLLWSVVRSACLCLHWYNPLVWWAASLSRRDCELACDEGALRRLGEGERLPYGRTLVAMIARASTPVALLQTATTMAANKKQLKERVAMIAKKRKLYTVVTVALLLVIGTVVGCTFAGAEIKPPVDSLDDVQRIPSKQTEPDDTEEPSEDSGSLREGDHYRIAQSQQSSAVQFALLDAEGNKVYSEIISGIDADDIQIHQVGDVLQFVKPTGESAFYDTARNYWTNGFEYSNVIAFNGKYVATYNGWEVAFIELFAPFSPPLWAQLDDALETQMPVTAAQFSESGESLTVSYINAQDEETTVEILLDEAVHYVREYVKDQVQEDYITNESYWAHVTSAVEVDFVDEYGIEHSVSIPRIEMPGPNIEAINQEIYDIYSETLPREDGKHQSIINDVSYKWFTNGDILSLVIMPTVSAGYSGDDYNIYNVSISKCRLLTDEEVYAASGVENYEVRVAHAIACYAGEYMTRSEDGYMLFLGSGNEEHTGGLFSDAIFWTNVENARPYLGRNGDLYINGCAYTGIGSGQHWGDIRLDDYDTDVVYTAWQYFEYFRRPEGERSWPTYVARVSPETQVSYTPSETVTATVYELTEGVKNSNFHIPQIGLPGPNIEAINQEIRNDYVIMPNPQFMQAVNYEWAVNGDILSLAIFATLDNGEVQTYSAYNVSISQCRLLSDEELYAAAGVESPETTVLHAISMAVAEGLAEWRYDEYYYDTYSSSVTMRILKKWQEPKMLERIDPYLNAEGKLCVYVWRDMYTYASSFRIAWQAVCISDYPTDRLYEPVDYFYTFYHG